MKFACGPRAQVAETNHEVFMVEYLATRLKGSKDGKVPFPVSLSSPFRPLPAPCSRSPALRT